MWIGGTELRVWDMLAGGRLLAKVSQHYKDITCMQLASNGKRLLTGGLDRHAKIYDVQSYQVVHTLDFPSPVLSLGITVRTDPLCPSHFVLERYADKIYSQKIYSSEDLLYRRLSSWNTFYFFSWYITFHYYSM